MNKKNEIMRVKDYFLIRLLFFSFPVLFLLTNTFSQTVSFDNGIVASAHPMASKAGVDILKAGGNAVDAAVASALVLAVVEPYASGLGGGGFITLKMKDEEPITIDYRETASMNALPEYYYGDENHFKTKTDLGKSAVGIPGVPAALNLLLNKYGTKSLDELADAAIKIARQGYVVNKTMAALIVEEYGRVSFAPETEKLFLIEGFPPEEGDTLYNTDFAITLENLIADGFDDFYKGKLSEKILEELKGNPESINAEDLFNYKPIIKKPVVGYYKGYKIISTAPPSGGGTHLIQLLNMLDELQISKFRNNSPEFIHLLAEAIKIAGLEKENYMGDPDFVDVPVDILTNKKYAAKLAGLISPDSVCSDSLYENLLNSESGSTTHLSVVDKEGNIVSLTQSINLFFGSGITVQGTGVLLNNHLGNFSSEPGRKNSIEPGKRPVSSIAPTIVFKDDEPFLCIGSPGGTRIIGTLAQILVNIIDYDMDLDEAISAPKIHATSSKVHLEGGIDETVVPYLENLGHVVETHRELDKYFGGAQAIMIKGGKLHGFADPRRGGNAQGY